MEELGTETLRKLAAHWSLAGDEKLLTVLQNTHQRLLARCQETNCQLQQMTTALDDASIRLQNVNNQFMSLSSSQFIESRVYDDDVDVTAHNTPGKQAGTPPPPADELAVLKRSVAVLHAQHEVITIVGDSDSSDTEDDLPDRQVMKPKDVYGDRPLPYIIGSEPWKNKWHAGLVAEGSDWASGSSGAGSDCEQLSREGPAAPRSPGSESSSDLPSEATPSTKPTPSDVATEIARRLGAGLPAPRVVDTLTAQASDEEPAADRPTARPQPQGHGTMFPDEPPPFDDFSDSDTDIFAELHRQRPYDSLPHGGRHVAEELFGGEGRGDAGDIFSDFASQPAASKPTSLFDAGPKPHMFDKQHITEPIPNSNTQSAGNIQQANDSVRAVDDKVVKRPIGGISLFGSNKGAENIGAAILQRNQRQSSSSDDGTESETLPPPHDQQLKKEKDIFDDLFAKNEKKKTITKDNNNIVKGIKQQIHKKQEENVKINTPKPIDLFSDNLFDDIDDIFTTNIVKTSKNSKNTIFEDDDGLFSEITEHKRDTTSSNGNNNKNNNKGLFDSDDDLFSEKPSLVSKPKPKELSVETTKTSLANQGVLPKETISTKTLFENDDENIYSDKINEAKSHNAPDGNDNINKPIGTKKIISSPSLFDDDDEDSDLFKESIKSPNVIQNKIDIDIANNKTKITTFENKSIDTLKSNEASDVMSNKSDNQVSELTDGINNVPPNSIENVTNKKNINKNDNILVEQDPMPSNNSSSGSIADVSINKCRKSDICDTKDNVGTADSNVDSNPVNSKTVSKMYDKSKIYYDDLNAPNFGYETQEKNNLHRSVNKTSDLINAKKPSFPVDNHKAHINIHDLDGDSVDEAIFSPQKEDREIPEATMGNNSDTTLNSDIFSDILSEPPVFEKLKEPKKSKNVNALFDDDSDDETLFFKKDDVVSDDTPEEFTPTENRLFDIFTNVPPEESFNKKDHLDHGLFHTAPKVPEIIQSSDNLPTLEAKNKNTNEVKSEQKISETCEPIGDIFKLLSEEAPEKTLPVKEADGVNKEAENMLKSSGLNTNEQQRFEKPDAKNVNTDDSFKSVVIKEKNSGSGDSFEQITNLNSSNTKKDIYFSDDNEDLFQSLPSRFPKPVPNLSETSDKSDDEQCQSLPNIDTKKTDKRETSQHSASSSQDKTYSEPVSPDENSEKKVGKLKIGLNINVKALLPGASPIKIKPVDNLDGQTQSNVKVEIEDSKLIQTVGFENKIDSEILDNKLSKERPRIQVKRRPSTRKARKEAVRKSGINFGEDSTDNSSSIDDPPKIQTQIQVDTVEKETISDILVNTLQDVDTVHMCEVKESAGSIDETGRIESKKPELVLEGENALSTMQPIRQPVKSNSTTKIVYILNDEDIFNTSNIETGDVSHESLRNSESINPNVATSSDNMICNTVYVNRIVEPQDVSSNNESSVKTLGKTYEVKDDKSKSSLFGDDDDDAIFRKKKPEVKASIFDSDSDGELFAINKKSDVKKSEVKGSLFGDDDDDDDLFGIKAKQTKDIQPQLKKTAPSVKETAASTHPVFEDPLSMFDEDD